MIGFKKADMITTLSSTIDTLLLYPPELYRILTSLLIKNKRPVLPHYTGFLSPPHFLAKAAKADYGEIQKILV